MMLRSASTRWSTDGAHHDGIIAGSDGAGGHRSSTMTNEANTVSLSWNRILRDVGHDGTTTSFEVGIISPSVLVALASTKESMT